MVKVFVCFVKSKVDEVWDCVFGKWSEFEEVFDKCLNSVILCFGVLSCNEVKELYSKVDMLIK